jgi:hypothetical protein
MAAQWQQSTNGLLRNRRDKHTGLTANWTCRRGWIRRATPRLRKRRSPPLSARPVKEIDVENLNLDPAKTAVLSLDIQEGVVRKSTMYRERNVGQSVRSVLDAARKTSMLVVHVVIDYRPFFSH